MFQTDQATAATSLPTPSAAGTPGYFTNGNPASGVAATILDADFMNMVMMELVNVVTGAGLTPSKTANNQILAAIRALTPGRLIRETLYINNGGTQQVSVNGGAFTTTGATTWTPLSGTSYFYAEVLGGGGSGAGAAATGASQVSGGSGGAAGSFAEGYFPISAVSGAQAITCGAGGAAATGFAANNGGSSSIGSLVSAPGGPGGVAFGPAAAPQTAAMNNGTIATGGQINMIGQVGQPTLISSASVAVSGAGGSSRYGVGGGPVYIGNIGAAAIGYGAGGGGCCQIASSAARASGAGTGGLIRIREYGSI
ncbi:hypothetical protein [Caballeronia zhejiangensis]|uniref:glycine-rich domain-containing protein n=1 Tax=Caballeronia zhejiangensis TaxID=871203 RepID=UPI00158EB79B|nr:hypothetical protein [Caballeronia zhejiangensis]